MPRPRRPAAAAASGSSAARGTHAQQLAEALAKVLRQERVDDRVQTAVEVREARGGDLERHFLVVVVLVDVDERVDEEGHVRRQPAQGERDDDSRHHSHHPASGSHRLPRRSSADLADVSADAASAADTMDKQDVEDADDGQRNGVAGGEERRVVDASIAFGRYGVVDVVQQTVDAVATRLVLPMVVHDAVPRRAVATTHHHLHARVTTNHLSAGSRIYKRGRQGRGAAGAEGVGVGRECPLPTVEGTGGRFPSPEFFPILDLKMATLGSFWAVCLQFSYLV